MNIIGHKYIFLSISGLLVAASFVAVATWGLKLGIDFTGGSLLEVRYKNGVPAIEEIEKTFQAIRLDDLIIQLSDDRTLLLRFGHVDEAEHQKIYEALETQAGKGNFEELQFTTIGPVIGTELKRKSLLALGLASLGIIAYLAFAFRNVSKPVSSWKYGVIAVTVAFLHDVAIPTGIFAILGHYGQVSIDTLFITALLTILGFSVHDTIVVFDRIRENLRKLKVAEPFESTVNKSINQTIARSVNTSLTTILALLAVFFFGGVTVKYFVLAMIIGIVFGTYSSIFVASPLLVIWSRLTKKG
jgi:preprotein translocase subunit SecF